MRGDNLKGKTVVDLYTKTVLTVIAVSLCALVLQNTVRSASAVGAGCGSLFNPCYVEGTVGVHGGPVQVLGSVQVTGSVHTY